MQQPATTLSSKNGGYTNMEYKWDKESARGRINNIMSL
jgi:hypothetical protein